MQVQVVQDGRVLPTILHEGQTYVETPTSGNYALRITNNFHRRRLAIVSVDGVNVINGKDASYEGGGYVLDAWQTVDIPGFRRDSGKVAAFEFSEQGDSYAAQTGRGTQNVGVIGVAVFDEKVQATVRTPPSRSWGARGMTLGGDDVFGARKSMTPRSRGPSGSSVQDVGTGYGQEKTFRTQEVTFDRSSDQPTLVLTLRYATRYRLESWGVPVIKPNTGPLAANPFPAAGPSVTPPPGWRG